MKLDKLLLLVGGGYLLYSYFNKKKVVTANNTSVKIEGCMNEEALNYNPLANISLGDSLEGCIFSEDDEDVLDYGVEGGDTGMPAPTQGCMDIMAVNFNPLAIVSDDSCYYADLPTNPTQIE